MKNIKNEIEVFNKLKRNLFLEEKMKFRFPDPVLHKSTKMIAFLLLQENELCDRQLFKQEIKDLNKGWLYKK